MRVSMHTMKRIGWACVAGARRLERLVNTLSMIVFYSASYYDCSGQMFCILVLGAFWHTTARHCMVAFSSNA